MSVFPGLHTARSTNAGTNGGPNSGKRDQVWIIAATETRARIYGKGFVIANSDQGCEDTLQLIHEIERPQFATRFGTTFIQRSFSMEFARQIASIIEEARSLNRFQHLILMADSQMLGGIREYLSKPSLVRIVGTSPQFNPAHGKVEIANEVREYLKRSDQLVTYSQSA